MLPPPRRQQPCSTACRAQQVRAGSNGGGGGSGGGSSSSSSSSRARKGSAESEKHPLWRGAGGRGRTETTRSAQHAPRAPGHRTRDGADKGRGRGWGAPAPPGDGAPEREAAIRAGHHRSTGPSAFFSFLSTNQGTIFDLGTKFCPVCDISIRHRTKSITARLLAALHQRQNARILQVAGPPLGRDED